MNDPSLPLLSRPESLTDRVVESLRAAILSGRMPAGTRLSVPELARQLGVSRTPAREALLVLEREGLVEPRAQGGVAVRRGNQAELDQLLELRETLDGMAARLAAERMTDAERRTLAETLAADEAALTAADMEQHFALDMEFHRLIAQGARNEPLTKSLAQVKQQLRILLLSLTSAARGMGGVVARDHAGIMAGLRARDSARAEEAARRHVRRMRRFYQSLGTTE